MFDTIHCKVCESCFFSGFANIAQVLFRILFQCFICLARFANRAVMFSLAGFCNTRETLCLSLVHFRYLILKLILNH